MIGTRNNLIEGNYVGLAADGSTPLPNQGEGVQIYEGAPSNIIGGTTAGAGNVISGNGGDGMIINASDGTLIQGNYIGTDFSGALAKANGGAGVYVWAGSQNTTVGGTSLAARNVISGNTGDGIDLNGVSNTTIQGNYIGLGVNGSTVRANSGSGVALFNGATANAIGGLSAGSGNIISGNGSDGIYLGGVTSNFVQGNYIGVDVNGSAPKGNTSVGVDIRGGSQNNTVGGNVAAARNIIAASGAYDVGVAGISTTGNTVLGNYIGLDVNGMNAIANNNSGVGVFGGAQNNTIGGTSGGSRIFISGHGAYGLFLADVGTAGNLVQGNTIGLNIAGTAKANGFQGVALFNGTQSNTIGGSTVGAGNIIASSAGAGVALFDATTIGNAISQNSIFSNDALGIDLNNDGVTSNDDCDGDSGPNNLQNFPVLTSASFNAGNVTLSGTLNSTASTTFRLEFFSNAACDSSGNGEGQTFLGSADVTTAANCNTTFGPLTFPLASGQTSVTSTATDPNRNTSEFSGCVPVTGAPTPTPTPTATPMPTPTSTPTPTPTVSISGTISYCSNPIPGPVPNVTLTLTGSGSGSTVSDSSGSYIFSSLIPGGSYIVTPTKAALAPGSAGINTIDAIAIQRHFLNFGTPLSGCRLTAADVNGVGGVSTVDVIAVQRFFLGLSTGIANTGMYQFSPVNRAYPGIVSDQTGQNYDALIFGDVASTFVH